jgi:putative ATP-dependent endonuclease of OLD family
VKISNFRVERLRSAYMVELQQIGALNVLIGKNNSGKSTILSAINAFFGSLKGEGLVTLKPSIGREIDFHDRNTELPIVIAASFLLGEAERTTLVTDIVREAPQLRNLMESMGKDLKVEVSLTFAPDPDSYAYVSTLDITGSSERLPTDSRNLLTISPETANELAARQRRIGYSNQAAEQVQRFLENFDSDDFTNIKDDETDIRSSIRFNISNVSNRRVPGDVLPQLVKELEQMLTLSTSFPEFRARVKSLREQYISELGEKKQRSKISSRLFPVTKQQYQLMQRIYSSESEKCLFCF